MAEINCESTKKNLGKSKCNKLPKLFKQMITTGDDFKLEPADFASASALKTKLQTAIKAGIASRIYLWPKFSGVENLSQETTYEDNPLTLIPVVPGQYRQKFHISKNLCAHKAMYSHNAINEGRVFLLDVANQLFGTLDSDGNIRGFSLALLNVEKLMFSDGTNSSKSPIFIALGDNEEIDENGVLIDGSSINQLEPLTDVEITIVGSVLSTGFTVEVKNACDGTPVAGLLLADFILYATDGVTPQTIQSVTADANVSGRYAIAAPGGNAFEDGTLTLRSAATLTVSAYEVPEALAINVP